LAKDGEVGDHFPLFTDFIFNPFGKRQSRIDALNGKKGWKIRWKSQSTSTLPKSKMMEGRGEIIENSQ
jgi:hypothetical protein